MFAEVSVVPRVNEEDGVNLLLNWRVAVVVQVEPGKQLL